ncbi:MAG: alpha/beta fold hydrolase [Candidatus Thermoplasmatota archaeon]
MTHPGALPKPGRFERRLVGLFVRSTMFRRRHATGWSVPAELAHEELRFEGNTGADLAGRHFLHPNPRGIVVLAHPDRRYGQHWFVKEGWIAWLLENRFSALTFDFTNYGASRGGSTYLFEDLVAAARVAREREPGIPVHIIGLSLGAFSAANASPELDFVESITLESPYPSFNSWYEGDGHRVGKAAMALFDKTWPRTAALIQADRRIAACNAKRILVAASSSDEVTAIALTRRVASGAPPTRTNLLEVAGVPHLGLFALPRYRAALLATLTGDGWPPSSAS